MAKKEYNIFRVRRTDTMRYSNGGAWAPIGRTYKDSDKEEAIEEAVRRVDNALWGIGQDRGIPKEDVPLDEVKGLIELIQMNLTTLKVTVHEGTTLYKEFKKTS